MIVQTTYWSCNPPTVSTFSIKAATTGFEHKHCTQRTPRCWTPDQERYHGFNRKSPNDLFDIIIVGAGISGINAAYRVQTELPSASYSILEARGCLGGTWDLFRYPGIRSDSDL